MSGPPDDDERLSEHGRLIACALTGVTLPPELRCGHPTAGPLSVNFDRDRREALVICCAQCYRPQVLADLGPGHRLTGTVRIYGLPPSKTH